MGILAEHAAIKKQQDAIDRRVKEIGTEVCILEAVLSLLESQGRELVSKERIEIEWEKFKSAVTLAQALLR